MDPVVWLLLVIVAGRGGIGKSLLANLLTTTFLSADRVPLLVQADIQHRLDALYPDITTTIDIGQIDQEDPLALARAFAEIPRVMRVGAASGRDQVIDTAATWHVPIIRYCAEIGLAEQVAALHGKMAFLLPTTADSDSLALTIEAAQTIEALVPAASIVFVRNSYPTKVSFDVSDLTNRFGKAEVQRLLNEHRQMVMPAISRGIWGVFERANLSPTAVITADPAELMSVAAADVDTVRIMQRRVEKWVNAFIEQAKQIEALRDDQEQ